MKRLITKILTIGCVGLGMLLLLGGGVIYVAARRSTLPDNINMSSSDGTDMSNINSMSIGTPNADATPALPR